MSHTNESARLTLSMGIDPYRRGVPVFDAEGGETLADYAERLRAYLIDRDTDTVTKLMKLPVIKNTSCFKRKVEQPVFKIEFETLEQIQLRLSGTLIFVGDELFLVQGITEGKNEGKRDFILQLIDYRSRTYRAWYSDPNIDLRSPDPQYILYNNRPAFMTRLARRQQQQGLHRHNTGIKYVGESRFSNLDNYRELQKGLQYRDTIKWDAKLAELMLKARAIQSLRLSNNIAAWVKSDDLLVEYKGRPLGQLKENCILCDGDDAKQPWVKRDTAAAGLELRVQ
jgi:hypothetical protein